MSSIQFSSALPVEPVNGEKVNNLMAMKELFILLNLVLMQSAQNQGAGADDISSALSKMADDVKALNSQAADIQKDIQAHNDSIHTAQFWQNLLGYACIALGVVAPALCGVYGIEMESGLQALSGATGIAEGGVTIHVGVQNLKLAALTKEFAGINGMISRENGAQQYYQSSSKWMTESMGETFTRMGALAQSFAADLRNVNRGIRQSNQDMLAGIYGSR